MYRNIVMSICTARLWGARRSAQADGTGAGVGHKDVWAGTSCGRFAAEEIGGDGPLASMPSPDLVHVIL